MLIVPDSLLFSGVSSRRLIPVVCALGIVCCGSPQSYVERGNRFTAAGKEADAAIQYEKAIQKNPDLGEAHYRLGLLDLKRNQALPAYRELLRASDLMPGNEDALFKLGQLALSIYNGNASHPQQFYDKAASVAAQLLKKKPDGYDGNLIEGAIALVDQRPADAVLSLQKAIAAKPGDPDAQLGLARALVDDDRAPEGIALAQGLVANNKAFGPAYDFLFAQFQTAGKKDEAADILRLKVANNPKQAVGIVELARYYASLQKAPEVNATIAKLTANPADFPDGRLIAGDFYLSVGKPDLALQQFNAGLGSATSATRNAYRKRMAAILASEKKWPETYQQVAAILKDQPNDDEARLMRALAWLDEGKPENLDRALAELQAQSKKRPNDPVLRFQTGNALARKGDRDGARREWAAAAQANPQYLPARYSLAESFLAADRGPDALQIAEQIIALAPRDTEARLLLATCLTAAGEYPRARAELDRLAAQYPQSAQVRFRLGVLDIADRRYKAAEDAFRQIGGAQAKDPQVLAGLAEALQGDHQGPQAIQMLQDELKRNPDSPVLRQMLARLAAVAGNYDVVVDQYQKMAAAAPGSTALQFSLASAYNAKGDTASALAVLQKLVQANPKSAPASLMLAQALVGTGRAEEAKVRYRKLLETEPDNANALNDLAYLMADSGENLDQALSYAQRGLQYAADPGLKTSLSDTMGWIMVKKNMTDDALQTLQILVNSHPGNATFRYHLGAAFFQKGDKQKARVELEAALAAKPSAMDEPRIRELLARI
jgi:tetratricopeptide (TPR) repeat protein